MLRIEPGFATYSSSAITLYYLRGPVFDSLSVFSFGLHPAVSGFTHPSLGLSWDSAFVSGANESHCSESYGELLFPQGPVYLSLMKHYCKWK